MPSKGAEPRRTIMSELTITNEDPVNLDATIDAAGSLQLVHGSDNLASYDQTMVAEHDDYNESGGLVRIKLLDFSNGGNTWQITASHASGSTNWTRSSNHAYYDFGLITGTVEVDVVAMSNAAPPQTRSRKIWVKTKPTDPLPDRP
jgi:hypothetical protein